jgi:Glycosyl transferase family group 2
MADANRRLEDLLRVREHLLAELAASRSKTSTPAGRLRGLEDVTPATAPRLDVAAHIHTPVAIDTVFGQRVEIVARPFDAFSDLSSFERALGCHFQHRVGRTLFGLHGSFILVRTSVERSTGFDFGAIGSITEDAFWALLQMAEGRQCRWVDGYVVEQAPRTLRDFVKQRRRWFVGPRACSPRPGCTSRRWR